MSTRRRPPRMCRVGKILAQGGQLREDMRRRHHVRLDFCVLAFVIVGWK
jgi:hypothetical protein